MRTQASIDFQADLMLYFQMRLTWVLLFLSARRNEILIFHFIKTKKATTLRDIQIIFDI